MGCGSHENVPLEFAKHCWVASQQESPQVVSRLAHWMGRAVQAALAVAASGSEQ